jgi:predicted aminopeptidase
MTARDEKVRIGTRASFRKFAITYYESCSYLKFLIVVGAMSPFFVSCYLTKQGWSQLGLLRKRQPIEEVMGDTSANSETKNKLKFVKEILAYAQDQGLKVGSAYQTYVQLDGPAVTYLVQAGRPEEFKLKTWWFPIVGTVPYLGFFDKADRDAYANELEADGFEVHRGGAAAFSSLGWFSDPIYSSMLNDSDFEIAHLLFHELTHQTAWIPGSVEFNENFAEFIADEMVKKFFTNLNRPQDIADEEDKLQDFRLFKSWLKDLKGSLETYFKSLDATVPKEKIIADKSALIAAAIQNKPKFRKFDIVSRGTWNTPRILGASLYSPDTAKFQKLYLCFGSPSLGSFAEWAKKELEETKGDLDGLLQKKCP